MPADNRQVVLAVLAVLAVFGLIAVVRGTRRQAHEAAHAVRSGAAAVNLAGRSLVYGGVIVVVQWAVVTHVDQRNAVFWVVLAVPACLASYTLARAFTVPPTVVHRRGGRH